MKKLRIARSGIALLAIMLVAGLTACPSGNNDNPDPGPGKSSIATLSSIKLANVEVANKGTPGNSFANATAGAATILTESVAVAVTPTDSKAAVGWQKVSGSDAPDPEDYWVEATMQFAATGDVLVIEVTAEDGTRQYYKIGITVATVALSSLSINGVSVTNMGSPAGTPEGVVNAGSVLFSFGEDHASNTGAIVAAGPTGATLEYAFATGDTAPTFGSTSTLNLADNGYVYIKVTSADGVSAVYKVRVNFLMAAKIKYGSPQIKSDSEKFIDPLWNNPDLEEYIINKRVTADPWDQDTFDSVGMTSGVGKALWDEYGLYVYVEVTDPDVSDTPGADSQAHTVDSVELFVNEAYPNTVYSNGGSQYRLGANGERSGEGNSPVVFNELNKTSAWKTDTGYVVIFQVPWQFRYKYPFDTPYLNDREIGFELQVNACNVEGGRYGTLVWTNAGNTNYMNATMYGTATLDASNKTGGAASLSFPAVKPTIDTQPTGGVFSGGDTVTLTVAASRLEKNGGTLTIQWYSADDAAGANPVAIDGATSETYTFTAPNEDVRLYIYAVVTNTLGATTATTKSSNATIIVANVPQVSQWTLGNAAYAAYKFTLLDNWANYEKLTASYYIDAANLAKSVRGNRLYGAYVDTDFVNVGANDAYKYVNVNGNNSGGQSFNGVYIMDGKSAGFPANAAANTWFTFDYDITGANGHDNFKEANPATSNPAEPAGSPKGVTGATFYFGIGFSGQQTFANAENALDPDRAIVQLIKDVTLVHKTNPALNVVSTGAGFAGQLGFIGYGGSDADPQNIAHELVDDPSGGPAILVPITLTGTDIGVPTLGGDGIAEGKLDLSYDDDTGFVTVYNYVTNVNGSITYKIAFPADLALYDKVEIFYTATQVVERELVKLVDENDEPILDDDEDEQFVWQDKVDGEGNLVLLNVSGQLTSRAGTANAFTGSFDVPNYAGANNSQYRTITEGTDVIMNAQASSFVLSSVPADGIGFQVNNWASGGANNPNVFGFNFKITKIVISPAE